jgi:hypothetical protein
MITASISLLASSTIAMMIWKRSCHESVLRPNERSSRSSSKYLSPYSRFIFALSISDIMLSLAILTGTFATPRHGNFYQDWAVGNATTCNLNGIALILGAGPSCMYTFVLTFYALYRVKHQMSRETFSQTFEMKFHFFIFLWNITFAIVAVSTRSINPIEGGFLCTLRGFPPNCDIDPEIYGECERGRNAVNYLIGFFYFPLVVGFIGMVVCLSSLSCYVFVVEHQMLVVAQDPGATSRRCRILSCLDRNTPSDRRHSTLKNVHEVSIESLIQSSLYVFVFVLTHATNFANVIALNYFGVELPTWALVMRLITYPLGGLFNILVYTRPKVKILRKKEPELSVTRSLYKVIMAGGDIPDELELDPCCLNNAEESETRLRIKAVAPPSMDNLVDVRCSMPSDANAIRFMSSEQDSSLAL